MIIELDKEINKQDLDSLKEFLKSLNLNVIDSKKVDKDLLIEKISKLNIDGQKDIIDWLYYKENELWDNQIEEDINNGKLDHLAKQELDKFNKGLYQEI